MSPLLAEHVAHEPENEGGAVGTPRPTKGRTG